MALSKVWVHAEAIEGTVAPITLEMLAKARELGRHRRVLLRRTRRRGASPAPLGAHGATKVHATGDLGGALPGVHVGRRAGRSRRRRGPRPDHVRHHLRRARHRRPACR